MSAATKYEALPQSEASQERPRQQLTSYNWTIRFILYLCLFTLYTFVLIWWSHRTAVAICTTQLSRWTPALNQIEYADTQYFGTVNATNRFRASGPPTPEIDRAWSEISIQIPGFRMHKEDFAKIGKSLDEKLWHTLPEDMGGGYLGVLEVSHLLHCLNAIRKSLYPSIYASEWEGVDEPHQRLHQNHCLDMLRQNLMCKADMGVIPTYDDPDPSKIYAVPDFSTTHKCRNFDKLLDWSYSNDRALHWGSVGEAAKIHRASVDPTP